MFGLYDWVIDTKKQKVVTVVHILSDELFVVQTDEDEFYIQSKSNLIEYDKYYFDKKEE